MTVQTETQNSRVLLALSGGVDSAVCAELLRRQGYATEGLFIHFSPAHAPAAQKAQKAAQEAGIPLHFADANALFEEAVVQPFCRAYAAGRTPNPCVVCNPLVKFHLLASTANTLGIPFISTGHYARLHREGENCCIAMAASTARDQSYMLYRLPQPVLRRLLLPAGELEKVDIRALARQLGFSSAEAPDSQEICFIPDGDYAAFLEARGVTGRPGHFISPTGQRLGPHAGVHRYTVGQRRGLNLSLGQPVFVKAILPGGDIQLAFRQGTLSSGILLQDTVRSCGKTAWEDETYTVKIRSMARPAPCQVKQLENGTLHVAFETPQYSPAPGQHAVLYHGSLVAGGGVIADVDD